MAGEAEDFMAAEEVSMGAEAELFTAAEEEASMAVEVSIAEAGSLAMAAPTAPDLLAEEVTVAKEVTAEAADLNLGAIKAHPQRGRRLVIRRIFVPPSTMVSGIRSSTLLIQPVQARDAIPQVLKAHASWRTALALPIPAGALLAQHEARPVWSADPPGERRPSVGAEMVGEAIGIAIGTVGGAGEVGASPSDGRTGAAIGARTGRSAGIPGGTARTGMPRGQSTITIQNPATIPITTTTGPTIRLRTGQTRLRIRLTAHRQTPGARRARTPMTSVLISTLTLFP